MGSRKTYTTITESLAQDQRVAVEGDVSALVAPGAALGGGPGTISAAPGSSVSQTVSMTGLGPDDVRMLLDPVYEDADREREALTGLATSMQAASAEQSRQLGGVIEATKAPQVTQAKTEVKERQDMWTAIGIVVVVFFVLHVVT